MTKDIDDIIAGVKRICPDVSIRQLDVRFPGADDDGLWYFTSPGFEGDLQIESSSYNCPFIIEWTGNRVYAVGNSVAEVIEKIVTVLRCRRT